MIQLLWDRGEANGYAHHMTGDPLPNTPAHTVLMHPAFGDHQVTNVAADVEARTIGAQAHDPVLDPGRSFERSPLFGIKRFASFPFGGSAIVYFDVGPIRAGRRRRRRDAADHGDAAAAAGLRQGPAPRAALGRARAGAEVGVPARRRAGRRRVRREAVLRGVLDRAARTGSGRRVLPGQLVRHVAQQRRVERRAATPSAPARPATRCRRPGRRSGCRFSVSAT